VNVSAEAPICGRSAPLRTDGRENNIAMRHNEHVEREFDFPY